MPTTRSTTSPSPSPPPPDASISPAAALTYWSSIPASVSGMLGGYPQISRTDLQGSANFLAKLRKTHPRPEPKSPRTGPPKRVPRAVDCGAGIGRVTRGLLLDVADVVDVVEPVAKFTAEIGGETAVGKDEKTAQRGVVGTIYNTGLESWYPSERYDVIWNQWCLGQLKDAALVAYLRRCAGALAGEGWVVVKENMNTEIGEGDAFDGTDSSVTRSDASFRRIFAEAGFRVVSTELQRGFPSSLGLFPVRIYALRPVGTG